MQPGNKSASYHDFLANKKNEARDDGVWGWQWHQLDHMQTICTSLQTDNHTNTTSLKFYRPDALSDAQPTVSKETRTRLAALCLGLPK